MPTYLGGNKNNKEAQPVFILKQGSTQSKRKLPVVGDTTMVEATAGTPTDRGNKAARPQGTSPMSRETDNELDVQSLEVMEIDGDEDAASEKDDQDSIDRAISSSRKELFVSASSSRSSRANKPWRPINPKDTPTQEAAASRSATFAAEMVFHEHASTPTDGEKTSSKTNECVVRMRFKLQSCDVQETLLGLLGHCLSALQERDKSACILNRRKTLEAKRVSDLPRDFTDFYDDWGLWEEDIHMFLNTIKDKGQRTFQASFYFRCSDDPDALFAKTLLKMAKQSQHKGTISIERKPCQHLDTTRDIIFFNLPFCDAVGLRDYLKAALTAEKSRLIHRYPNKFLRKDWGRAFQDFEMVRDFVKNTPWRSREEKATIQVFHKLVWHMECPREEVGYI